MSDQSKKWRPRLLSFAAAALASALVSAAAVDRPFAAEEQSTAAYGDWQTQAATHLRQSLGDTKVGGDVTVTVVLTVLRDGTIAGVLFRGTTDPRALAAAQRMVLRAGRLPPLPASVTQNFVTLTLPLRFR